MIRRLSAAAAFAALLPAAASAQSFEYAAGSGQYRVVSNTKLAQEVMGTRNELETSADQKVSLTIARKAQDTLAVSVVLDSVTLKSSGPSADISALLGMKVNSFVSPTGFFYSSEQQADPAKAQVAMELGRMLPRLRAKLAAGDSWTDTTTDKLTQNGLQIERTIVATNKVLGDTTFAGEKALRIERSHATTLSGSGDMGGQALTLEGTQSGAGTVYVSSSKGLFLGSVSKEQSKNNVTLVANGMVIPVTSESTTQIERIR